MELTIDNLKAYLQARIIELWYEDDKLSVSVDFESHAAGMGRGRLFEAIDLWDKHKFTTDNIAVNDILKWYHQY